MGAKEVAAQGAIASAQIAPVIASMATSVANLSSIIATTNVKVTELLTNGKITVPLVDTNGKEISEALLDISEAIEQLRANREEPEKYPAGKFNQAYIAEMMKKNADNIKTITEYLEAEQVQLLTEVTNIAAEKNSTIVFPFPEEALPNVIKKLTDDKS